MVAIVLLMALVACRLAAPQMAKPHIMMLLIDDLR
jgi:hypothetical protein